MLTLRLPMQREEGRCLRFLIEMKFLCLCCPFCFDILVLCSLKALNPKNSLNAKEIQRKTDGGWLVSDPTRKHDDFCGLLSGVVHGGRLKPNWDTAVKYDMKSFETLWWWSQNCQNWIFELGKNLFTPWKQRSLIETPKHKPNRNKAPTWQGSCPHLVTRYMHTQNPPPQTHPSSFSNMISPHVGQKPSLSHTFSGCYPCPVIISFVSELQTHSCICAVKLTWWKKVSKSRETSFDYRKLKLPPFLLEAFGQPNQLGECNTTKKTPPFLSWSFGVEANRHGSV